jgi:hypothetical protein
MTHNRDFREWQTWQKPDRRPIYEWAECIELPGSYTMPGRFDVQKTRPLIALFDAMQNDLVRQVHFRKPPQFGGTLAVDIAIPWAALNSPGPIMWAWQSDQDARQHMKEKAWPTWKACKQFAALLPEERNDATTTEIYFGPFFLTVNGCGMNSLQSKSIRWLFCDEIWVPAWQKSFQWAVARTRGFERVGNSKVVTISHAGIKGDVEDKQWLQGNQGAWAILADGKYHELSFGGKRKDGTRWGLVWNDDAKRPDKTWNIARACETARYELEDGTRSWPDNDATRAEWNRDGKYVDTNQDAPASLRSYATNALMNRTLAGLVEQKLNAITEARRGNIDPIKVWKQQCEALPWEEEQITITISSQQSGYVCADHFNGQRWDGEVDRFMTIDRQRGMAGDVPHWWVEVRAWKGEGGSRQVYAGRVETIEAARDIQLRLGVADRKTMEDARFDTAHVYEDCARYGWIAGFGNDEKFWTHVIGGQKVRLPYSQIQKTVIGNRAVLLMHFNAEYMKDILSRLVTGAGAVFEMPDDMDPRLRDHYQAEHKVEIKTGVFRWRKLHATKANHLWDCSAMQVMFALITHRLGLHPLPPPQDQTGQDQPPQ